MSTDTDTTMPEDAPEAPEATETDAPVEEPSAADAKREAANAKREATKLRKELEALRAAEEERRLAEMSELEREREKAAMLEAELTRVRDEAVRAERSAWLREAAGAAKIDADVATALIGLGEIEDRDAAAAAIADLAKAKPHLVIGDAPAAPPKVGTQAPPAPAAEATPEAQMGSFLMNILTRR